MDNSQLAERIQTVVGFRPREAQIDAIRILTYERKDLILIAPTGWGKSVVFQSVPILREGICIMIMPLTLLEEDQVAMILFLFLRTSYLYLPDFILKAMSISKIAGCRPCVLNSASKNSRLLEKIANGEYTHSTVTVF
ncbi:hypothetical protein V1525DRAFT_415745 [Lipomyces kononenkoae]|uniref:Uncharacterized protein n=1 Tax=Lipomyces kononenkoae TaxID=34357 RepID=A0ACC3SRF2_LIPKO